MKQVRKQLKPPSKKFFFRVDWVAYKLLEEEKKAAGFNSMYELGQCIIACYLRYVKKKRNLLSVEEESEFLNDEAKRMYGDTALFDEFRMQVVQPKRKPTESAKVQFANETSNAVQSELPFKPYVVNKTNEVSMVVNEMFSTMSKAERHFEFIKPKRRHYAPSVDTLAQTNIAPFRVGTKMISRTKEYRELTDYSEQSDTRQPLVQEQNRKYIDRFVSENYSKLNDRFNNQRELITSNAGGSIDNLNDAILSLYTDSEMCFTDWEQANKYLTSKFTDKAIRVVMKKPKREESENEDNNENEII